MSKIEQSENTVEFMPSSQSFPAILEFPEVSLPLEVQNMQIDFMLKNELLAQQKARDLYQYEIERKKLEIEDKKIKNEDQRITDDRRERIIRFFAIIGLILIFGGSFYSLIYFGKEEILIELIKSNPLPSIIVLFSSLVGVVSSGSIIKKWINKDNGQSENKSSDNI